MPRRRERELVLRGTSRGKSVAGGKDGVVAKEDRENGALWGKGFPKGKESGGLEKNEELDAGRRGRRGGRGTRFLCGRTKKTRASEEGRGER